MKWLAFALVSSLCVGCGPSLHGNGNGSSPPSDGEGKSHLIHWGYDTNAIQPADGPRLNASLTVKPFVDKRREREPAAVFDSEVNPVNLDGRVQCVNFEKHYAGPMPEEFASVIAKHVERRKVFVPLDEHASAYVLEGSVVEALGKQAPKGQALISVVFRDLHLRDPRSGKVKEIPDVTVDYSPPSSGFNCSAIFGLVSDQLAVAVTTLLVSVEWTARWWSAETKLPDGKGRLPPEVIQSVVRQNYDKFRRCYEEGLSRDPNLQGRVTVRFVINLDGTVTSVKDEGSELPDKKVRSCILEEYKTLSFPKPQGGIVTVVYPIMFSPG